MLTIQFSMVSAGRDNCKLQFTVQKLRGQISCANMSRLSETFSPVMDLLHWTVLHTAHAADAEGLPVTTG